MGLAPYINLHQLSPLISLLCTLAGVGGLLIGNDWEAMALSQWRFNPETYELRFTTDRAIAPDFFLLKNPTRIVIDLPETTWKGKPVHQQYSGLVKELRIAQFETDVTRIVLELSPEAKLLSPTINLDRHSTSQVIQWQLTPEIKKVDFPLDTLLQLPPPTLVEHRSSITVNVPPLVTKEAMSSSLPQATLSLAAGTEFNVRYRGKTPLILKIDQPWQEILFLEYALTNHQGKVIAPKKLPVIGYFETTPQGTRFITEGLIMTLGPITSSQTASIISLKAQSQLFSNPTSSNVKKVTIPPNTVFTLDLTENWHYQ